MPAARHRITLICLAGTALVEGIGRGAVADAVMGASVGAVALAAVGADVIPSKQVSVRTVALRIRARES
jgi:hypothetical protein